MTLKRAPKGPFSRRKSDTHTCQRRMQSCMLQHIAIGIHAF